MILDFAAAADTPASAIGTSITTGVVPSIDDSIATAARIRAVSLPHDRSTAAPVDPAVVDRTATAPGIRAVDPPQDPSITAAVSLVVVDIESAAG